MVRVRVKPDNPRKKWKFNDLLEPGSSHVIETPLMSLAHPQGTPVPDAKMWLQDRFAGGGAVGARKRKTKVGGVKPAARRMKRGGAVKRPRRSAY